MTTNSLTFSIYANKIVTFATTNSQYCKQKISMRILSICLSMLVYTLSFSQDEIELRDKSTLSARIIQEDKEKVVYLTRGENGAVVHTLPADQVRKIRYEKIPGSVNVIEIEHDSLENEFLLNDIINHLIVSGYIIEEFDNKYYTVSTQYENDDRFSVEIIKNKANFRCFHQSIEDELYPHLNATVAYGKKPKPGEKTGFPGSPAFKKLDAVCRSYLKDGNGELRYRSEPVD